MEYDSYNPIENQELDDLVKSGTCKCGEKKTACVTFCRDCYLTLPYELRIDLWKPWNAGFAEVYQSCISYLEKETRRYTCQKKKNTQLSAISTLSSDKVKKKSSGKRSRKTSLKSASAQET